MSFGETDLNADEVVTYAARLAVSSEELAAQLAGPLAAIQAIHAAAPWGQDDPGRAFQDSYLGADIDGVDGIVAATGALSERAGSVAETTGVGAIETEQHDELTRAELERQTSEAEAAHQRLAELRDGGGMAAVLADQDAAQQLWDLRWMIQDPAVADRLGADQVTQIDEFLDDVQEAAG
jgi:hypothetical protein